MSAFPPLVGADANQRLPVAEVLEGYGTLKRLADAANPTAKPELGGFIVRLDVEAKAESLRAFGLALRVYARLRRSGAQGFNSNGNAILARNLARLRGHLLLGDQRMPSHTL